MVSQGYSISPSLAISIVSAAIAFVSAWTAVRTFGHSRRTAYTQLRPWVCYQDTRIDLIEEPNGQRHLAFSIAWRNAGSTPARAVQVTLQGLALPTAHDAHKHAFDPVPLDENLSGIIGPGTALESPTGTLRLEDFRSGSTVFYSRVTYKDIFSEQQHVSDARVLIRAQHKSATETTFYHQVMSATAS